MVTIELIDALRDFITAQVKEYEYEFQRPNGEVDRKTPIVHSAFLPIRTTAETEYSPFVVVRLIKINDEQDASYADLRIVFDVHDTDAEANWRSLFNLMEHVRQALLKTRTIGKKFRIKLPLTYEAAVYSQSPYPEGYGFLNATYQIGQPIEEDLLNEYYGKEL